MVEQQLTQKERIEINAFEDLATDFVKGLIKSEKDIEVRGFRFKPNKHFYHIIAKEQAHYVENGGRESKDFCLENFDWNMEIVFGILLDYVSVEISDEKVKRDFTCVDPDTPAEKFYDRLSLSSRSDHTGAGPFEE